MDNHFLPAVFGLIGGAEMISLINFTSEDLQKGSELLSSQFIDGGDKGGIRISYPTFKDGSRNWCATCTHNDEDGFCFEKCCMYQQNADGTYNHDLPPTEYKEES